MRLFIRGILRLRGIEVKGIRMTVRTPPGAGIVEAGWIVEGEGETKGINPIGGAESGLDEESKLAK